MIKRSLILMSLALLFWNACTPVEMPSASGNVTLAFRVGEPATRAGDGVVADGGGIYCIKEAGPVYTPDLHIFICDRETGAVVKHYPEIGVVEECDWVSGDKATYLAVSFSFSGEGTYSVYALANVGDLASGNLEISSSLAGITNASQLDAMILTLTDAALSANALASPDVGTRMPLSAKGILHVEPGLSAGKYNGHVELELLRCVNQVQLSFQNLTGSELNIYNCTVTFKQLNAKQGWLFPADPDFVELGDGADSDKFDDNYRDFTSTARDLTGIPAADDPATGSIDEREMALFTSPVRFFPSVAPPQTTPSKGNRYLCDISFRVARAGKTYNPSNSGTYDTKNFTNLPIHDPRSQDIQELKRNQYLQIVTTISNGSNVSFNFIVKEWTGHTETVEFN